MLESCRRPICTPNFSFLSLLWFELRSFLRGNNSLTFSYILQCILPPPLPPLVGTVLHCTVLYFTVMYQYNTIQYNTIQYNTIQQQTTNNKQQEPTRTNKDNKNQQEPKRTNNNQ